MLKRLAISCSLLLAFAVLQVHNFMPHHHDTEHITAEHHHNDSQDKDADHSSPFTDLTHSAEFGKTVVKPYSFENIIGKPVLFSSHFILLYDKLALLKDPDKCYPPPDNDSPLHLIFLTHSIPFRAPPALPSC